MTARPLIIGNGQLGSAFKNLYQDQADYTDRSQLDLVTVNLDDYRELLGRFAPSIVINTAAYTAVDKAEQEQNLAHQVNALAPGLLAQVCAEFNVPFIHFSTDYVFDGSASQARNERASTAPINHYGVTKLAGEQAIQAAGGHYLIFRISWVYDASHHNFLNTMLKLAVDREKLSVVGDQIGAPCYAADIASYTQKTIEQLDDHTDFPSGIYHMCHQGETSWHGFAKAIFAGARKQGAKLAIQSVEPISTADYPTPAQRPLNSRLNCEKLDKIFGVTLPSWQDGLTRCLEEKYAS